MTDNIENIVIEHLKALRGEIKEFRSKHGCGYDGHQTSVNFS